MRNKGKLADLAPDDLFIEDQKISVPESALATGRGDTIEFSNNKKKVVTTLVERKSGLVYIIKNDSKHSRGVMAKIGGKLAALPDSMHKTVTLDQGSEFANHRQLEK